VVPSFDGHIYVIEGPLQCAERIDIGEHIYSTPLITDVTGDGKLDMVVGTSLVLDDVCVLFITHKNRQ
jgi:hypothetical protein